MLMASKEAKVLLELLMDTLLVGVSTLERTHGTIKIHMLSLTVRSRTLKF